MSDLSKWIAEAEGRESCNPYHCENCEEHSRALSLLKAALAVVEKVREWGETANKYEAGSVEAKMYRALAAFDKAAGDALLSALEQGDK